MLNHCVTTVIKHVISCCQKLQTVTYSLQLSPIQCRYIMDLRNFWTWNISVEKREQLVILTQTKLVISTPLQCEDSNKLITRNLAVANISCLSCAHNMSTASIVTLVTLKSKLGVTQGHWKWHCSIDHI